MSLNRFNYWLVQVFALLLGHHLSPEYQSWLLWQVSEYTGDSVLIEFETIVEHVTCNDVVTPYRVLVDMSDVIDTVVGRFPRVDVTIRFGGLEFVARIGMNCILCGDPPPPPWDIKPEAGLYYSEGVIQVKINDGLFKTYQPLEFGYGEYSVADLSEGISNKIPNLTGRWAFADDNSNKWNETSPLPSTVLPLVFDIKQGINTDPPPPVVTPPPAESIGYSILNIEGEVVAVMVCAYVDEMVCDLKSPTMDGFDSWFRVRALSIERILMKNMAEDDPQNGVRIGEGTAVRID